ncbi:MAG: hypothetical protein KDK78_04580 [Chlamydiia bacterium]|nr:hypothetical protein [Chlamydiia bacterium]
MQTSSTSNDILVPRGDFSEIHPFSNPDERKLAIQKVADRVAGMWSYFLNAQSQTEEQLKALREEGMWMMGSQPLVDMPSHDLVGRFQDYLSQALVKELSQGGATCLSTDYNPVDLLLKVWRASGLDAYNQDLYAFFPAKACVWIFTQADAFKVNYRFKGPLF